MNNPSSVFYPEAWEKPSPKEITDYYNSLGSYKESKKGGLLVFRKHLSPLSVYKYLVARFGNPYGFQTMVKNPNNSDNLFHWDYIIKAEDKWIYIQGGNRDIHVAISGENMSPRSWVKFAVNLKNDFKRFTKEMQGVGANLEKWNVVSNRFALIADACSKFHEILIENSEVPNFNPVKHSSEDGIENYQKQIKNISERAEKIFSASLSLDLITPILAESFINLLIFVARKEELKRNSRQYEQYIRQPIDTRVFDLHLKCEHFEKGVDPDSEEYRSFKRVMDRRNYNLHGNIDPKKDVVETVYFDKFIPLFENGGDPVLDLFAHQERIYDVSGVLSRYNDIHMFFLYVLGLMKDVPREEFEIILSESTFGFDLSRNRLGKLFPAKQFMMLVQAEYDDELEVEWR